MTVLRVLAWLIVVLSVWQLSSVAATNFPSLPPLAPDHVLSLKSRGNTPTSIKFINSSGHPVDVYWVDFVGHPIFYQHLVAAQAYIQQTYVNHPWIIYDDVVSSYVVGFVAIATAADAVIKGPGLQSFGVKPNTISGSDSSSRSSNGKTTVTGPAPVASDCSTAISPTERRICADSSLAKMDQEMGVLYRNLIGKAKDVMAWKADQRAWLVERDRCKNDDGCLRSEYQERLVILRTAEPTDQWAGRWWRVDASGNNGSKLVITHGTPHSFAFSLLASAGANTGDLSGKAIINNSNKAHWHSTDEDFPNCSLDFERLLNRLNIGGRADEISCGAGMGVDFSGTYVASDNDPNTTPDLLSLGVLQTTAQDNVLRKLLGKDYDTMAKTANIQVNDDNLDGNGATVVSMFVRGLACNTKSVLMFDIKGHLWAAVWESVSNSPDIVELRYYTNVASDKNTLPKTISAQREACPGDTVRVRMMP